MKVELDADDLELICGALQDLRHRIQSYAKLARKDPPDMDRVVRLYGRLSLFLDREKRKEQQNDEQE